MTPATPLRLVVLDANDEIGATGPSLLAAFATSDLRNIDEHFGSATRFAVYRVFADRDESVSVTSFEAAKQDGNENKLAAKIAALEGCAAVFCQACGGSAIRQLMAQSIQPIKVDAGTTVAATLAFLRGEVARPTAPWIVKALAGASKHDEGRFAAMASESWQE
jgi:nitrogen fixation protein NifX